MSLDGFDGGVCGADVFAIMYLVLDGAGVEAELDAQAAWSMADDRIERADPAGG